MTQNEEPMVQITKVEYNNLVKDQKWLRCLEGAGVDNWDGWDYAVDLLNEWYPE